MLNFDEHLHNIQSKVNRITEIIRSFPNVLPRPALLTICKSFTRPHLDYGDIISWRYSSMIIYNKAYSESFKSKLESKNLINKMQLLQSLVQ